MMKMLLPSISIIILQKKMKMFLMIFPVLFIYCLMLMLNNKMIMTNQFLYSDQLSLIMITLSFMSTILIVLSSILLKEISKTIYPILIILIMTFSMYNMFHFYIMFELVLIPTMILITMSGKQPERLQAGIYLLIYTITASLPLLISILMLKNNFSFMMIYMSLLKFKFIIFMMLAFLAKMPMFMMHLWLPKAHVEAPLEGSMILAAVLLKLGGYGLIRLLPICLSKSMNINFWMISIGLLGASATSLNCIRQKDLKSLIAYSSVAHMGLILTSIFTMNYIGLTGTIIMMIAHGLSSSALFLLVNDLYVKLHSRNIILFKGLMLISPNIIFWWFMFMAINISAPPSINTVSEIFMMSSLITWSKMTIIPIMVASFMGASFSLSLFINITHNKNEMLSFSPSNHKIFLSLFMHMIPLIILLMKMSMMQY